MESYESLKLKFTSMSSNDLLTNDNDKNNAISLIMEAAHKDHLKKGFMTSTKSLIHWVELLDYVLSKQPKLATESKINQYNGFPFVIANNVREIYTKYYDSGADHDACTICFSSILKNTLIKICNCEIGVVHLYCAQQLIINGHINCVACKCEYQVCEIRKRSIERYDSRIYFPFLDCYPLPLMINHYIFHLDGFTDKLTYAIFFLQIKRIVCLIDNATMDDINNFIKYVKTLSMYIYFVITETNEFLFKITMPSNLLRENNKEAFDRFYSTLL